MDLASIGTWYEFLRFAGSVFAVILLGFGLKYIHALELRSVDAICGFYAILKMNLLNLKRSLKSPRGVTDSAAASAFMWLSQSRACSNYLIET